MSQNPSNQHSQFPYQRPLHSFQNPSQFQNHPQTYQNYSQTYQNHSQPYQNNSQTYQNQSQNYQNQYQNYQNPPPQNPSYQNKSMKDLLNELVKLNYLTSQKVYNSMLKVDRADFSPTSPYINLPQKINYNVVISAPVLHAYCLQKLENHLLEGKKVLDIGFGSGYLTVAMSKMMNDKGLVLGIEHIKDLYYFGMRNISKNHKYLLDKGIINLYCCDGRLGLKDEMPFYCIHVGAASEYIPQILLDQLDFGGRMVIPIGKDGDVQFIYIVDKDLNGKVSYTKELEVRYVPLTSVEKQLGK